MPVLIINLEKSVRIPFSPGQSVREILDATDFRVRTGCAGGGACGLCRVQIECGDVGEPTQIERIHLDDRSLAQGIRLACEIRPAEDLQINILDAVPKSNWKRPLRGTPRSYPALFPDDLPGDVLRPLAVAVDLGTTFIEISMWDMYGGRYLSGRRGLNPQTLWGADVVARLTAASESEEKARQLSRQARNAIAEALLEIATREGINLHDVTRLAVVGNTAMLALLCGCNYNLLLQPKYWTTPIECLADNTSTWSTDFNIHPSAAIEVIPPVAGFVGSDLLAGIIATTLTEMEFGGLFIDFGTNSEIALWDGATLWITSAAGGPAFEGNGISCGMPAEEGAISRVFLNAEALEFDVVGGCEPLGLCGSALVDLLAILVRSGHIDSTGRFTIPVSRHGFVVRRGNPDIFFTKRDIDILQRAKAAIAAGVTILMARAGMTRKELRALCIGGAFGNCLNFASAREVGLLPDIDPVFLGLGGNTALHGCEEILLSTAAQDRLEKLRACAQVINLAECRDFDDHYMDNLYLQPMHLD